MTVNPSTTNDQTHLTDTITSLLDFLLKPIRSELSPVFIVLSVFPSRLFCDFTSGANKNTERSRKAGVVLIIIHCSPGSQSGLSSLLLLLQSGTSFIDQAVTLCNLPKNCPGGLAKKPTPLIFRCLFI